MSNRIAAGLLAVLALLAGCAGSAWREARSEDTIAAYHAFLREYPDTTFAEEARARLELARIRKRPSLEAFEAFKREFDSPALVAELRPHVEEVYFHHARTLGTAGAYRSFLEEFPGGQFAARATGNIAYLESDGFGGNAAALAAFVSEHPESDYAAEAERTVSAIEARSRTRFSRVGLIVDVSASTPGRDRVARAFRDRAVAAYAGAGLKVSPVASLAKAREAGLSAVLSIRHEESETIAQLEGGQVTEPGIVASTSVELRRLDEKHAIWADTFEHWVPLSARREGHSILFGPGSHSTFWAELDGAFFVPVARWSTHLTARDPWKFKKPAVSVQVVGRRAVALFGDGDFELLDLGDPAQPVRLGEYRRPRDLATFSGVAMDGTDVLIHGPDGAELVRLDASGPRRVFALGREVIGSVRDVARLGGQWLAATNRGLVLLGESPGDVRLLVPRPILGMARTSSERVAFVDGISLYTATLPQLLSGRVGSELRLGRGFHPHRVRAHGEEGSAVVLGERDAVWVDLGAGRARLRSRVGGTESGRIRDAAVIGGRLFLLGPRGLQVADSSGERIVDSVDVAAREHIDVAGRHLVMIGERSLQVVDATPFLTPAPASPAR